MKKVHRRNMKSIQKKAIKDVKHQKEKALKSPSLGQDKIIMALHDHMDEILHTDAIAYQDHKHKHVRVPKIRRISHKVK